MNVSAALVPMTAHAVDLMNDKNENIDGERILPQNYQTNCSSVPKLKRKGRLFEVTGQGEMEGTLRLENYLMFSSFFLYLTPLCTEVMS